LRRTHFEASFLVVCPLISGAFFGVIAAVLVRWSGSPRALGAGVLVGGAMFVANAVALCVVQSISRSAPVSARSPRAAANGARGARHAS